MGLRDVIDRQIRESIKSDTAPMSHEVNIATPIKEKSRVKPENLIILVVLGLLFGIIGAFIFPVIYLIYCSLKPREYFEDNIGYCNTCKEKTIHRSISKNWGLRRSQCLKCGSKKVDGF
ncbi:MAG: hypothetical protein FJY77_04130 [Candidatus Altiarchaeales archaeon]|nr:hypothetical protein [Candidatus Altiarchaeales archaeon]